MNLDARTQRSLFRLLAMLLILAAAVVVVMFVPNQQLQLLAIGLAAAVIMAIEEWLKNSGDNAAPTVAAVNEAMQPTTISTGFQPTITTTAGPPRTVSPPSAPTPKL